MADFDGEDRRTYPRAPLRFDVSVDTEYMPELPVRALNLSASGIYCESSSSIGELKRVQLVLKIEEMDIEIKARAVVIREERFPDGNYGIGMFFTSIPDGDRATIAELVATRKGKA
jgi:hypothetical protein